MSGSNLNTDKLDGARVTGTPTFKGQGPGLVNVFWVVWKLYFTEE